VAVFSVEGKLGTGKTKFCVWRAQQALMQGRRVASNVDLRLDKLLPPGKRVTYIRIPDKPTADDLDAIGHGNPESYDEDRNGVLILDELGTWLNARTFNDKSRAPLIDWLIHARKLGWDVYLIVQNANMIDRQVREALIEYQCVCRRLDKVVIPFIGKLVNSVFGGRAGYLPRMHMVAARVGEGTTAIVAERWIYRGDDLHEAYDTRQVFTPRYPHGAHCVVSFDPVPVSVPWWHAIFKPRKAATTAERFAPASPRPSKLRTVQLLERLPPDERIRHWRRLERLGLLHA
jgi:hypothetical protein